MFMVLGFRGSGVRSIGLGFRLSGSGPIYWDLGLAGWVEECMVSQRFAQEGCTLPPTDAEAHMGL